MARWAAGSVCAGLTAWGLGVWPLGGLCLAAAIALYAALLWRWPVVFLVVLPIVLPALDLGLWTGWMVVTEADLFVLVTLAVLLARVRPSRADLLPAALPGAVLLLLIVSTAISAAIGLASPFGFDGQSANPFLRPDNALRLTKGAAEALALLPFLRHRQRTRADAAGWLAAGIAAGLLAVAAEVLAERWLFAGVLDFHSEYRVAGLFASMHVGGGHIGAYLALALPFVFVVPSPARQLPLAVLAGVGGAYALIVTFARTGYAAGLVGCAATGLVLLGARWRRGGAARILAVAPAVLVVAAVAAASFSAVMRQRLTVAATDLVARESNWQAGWAVRDHDMVTTIFGMGLGTYQRAMLSRATVDRPSDFGLTRDHAGTFVWIRSNTPFYWGQKVVLPAGAVHLTLRFRGATPDAMLAWALCDKVLLYADNCQGGEVLPAAPGQWQSVTAAMQTAGLGGSVLHGLLRRPVELSLFSPKIGSVIAIRDISLTDDAGRQLLTNGDFRNGTDRWLFTDDSHVSWRILNQYLMLVFETGILGLTAYLALAGLAIAGGVRTAIAADPAGAAVAGSILSFLISGLFDNVLEAPRVAALFYLICLTGLSLWEQPNRALEMLDASAVPRVQAGGAVARGGRAFPPPRH